jgi:hypothetical protein
MSTTPDCGMSRFVVGSDRKPSGPFDAAIGSCVVAHQIDPVKFLRRVASAVKLDGIVAFMQPALHTNIHMYLESDSFARSPTV